MASWIILRSVLVFELYNFYTRHQESQLACQGDGGMREALGIFQPKFEKVTEFDFQLIDAVLTVAAQRLLLY